MICFYSLEASAPAFAFDTAVAAPVYCTQAVPKITAQSRSSRLMWSFEIGSFDERRRHNTHKRAQSQKSTFFERRDRERATPKSDKSTAHISTAGETLEALSERPDDDGHSVQERLGKVDGRRTNSQNTRQLEKSNRATKTCNGAHAAPFALLTSDCSEACVFSRSWILCSMSSSMITCSARGRGASLLASTAGLPTVPSPVPPILPYTCMVIV